MEPSLTITFTWDNTTGIFYGTLPSGARFAVSRSEVSGKLESNLTLFRQAVTPLSDGRSFRSKDDVRREIAGLAITSEQPNPFDNLILDLDP